MTMEAALQSSLYLSQRPLSTAQNLSNTIAMEAEAASCFRYYSQTPFSTEQNISNTITIEAEAAGSSPDCNQKPLCIEQNLMIRQS